MNITKEQIEQLTRVYNTLFEITTKGEDTLVMADCIRAFQQAIIEIKSNPISNENNTIEGG